MVHITNESASAPIVQAAVPMLDLQQFCGTEVYRPYLMKPFSRYGFTWATNGHILVRVAERGEFPDCGEKKLNIAKPFDGIEDATFFTPSFVLPAVPLEKTACKSCDGRGHLHDCPDCECTCESCDGEGIGDGERLMSANIGPTPFSLNYIRQILSLPGIELETLPNEQSEKPFFFRFEGGVGALMPLRMPRIEHVDIKLSAA